MQDNKALSIQHSARIDLERIKTGVAEC